MQNTILNTDRKKARITALVLSVLLILTLFPTWSYAGDAPDPPAKPIKILCEITGVVKEVEEDIKVTINATGVVIPDEWGGSRYAQIDVSSDTGGVFYQSTRTNLYTSIEQVLQAGNFDGQDGVITISAAVYSSGTAYLNIGDEDSPIYVPAEGPVIEIARATYSFTMDNSPPVIDLHPVDLKPIGKNNLPYVLPYSAYDLYSDFELAAFLDGQPLVITDEGIVVTETVIESAGGDGNHEIVLVGEDTLGNTTQASYSPLFDLTAPEINLDISDDWVTTFPHDVSFTSPFVAGTNFAVSVGGIPLGNAVRVDGDNYKFTISAEAAALIGDGEKAVVITGTDQAGNTGYANEEIYIDANVPTLDITGITDGYYYQSVPSALTIDFVEKNVASVVVDVAGDGMSDSFTFDSLTVNENGVGSITFADFPARFADLFEEDGAYTITAVGYDDAEQASSPGSAQFNIDKTAPSISDVRISGAPNSNGWYNTAPINLEWDISDTGSKLNEIATKVNGQVKNKTNDYAGDSSTTYSFDLTEQMIASLATAGGRYTVITTATDRSIGNNTGTSTTELKIDLVDPVIGLTGVTDGAYLKSPEALSITVTDLNATEAGSVVTVNINGEETTYERLENIPLSAANFSEDGHYTVLVDAEDAAGNTATRKSVSFTVDGTAPVISSLTTDSHPNTNGWFDSALGFTWNIADPTSGIKEVTAKIGDATVFSKSESEKTLTGSYQADLESALIAALAGAGGNYTITVGSKDYAGNETTSSLSVKVDTVKPNLSVSGITDGSFNQGSPTLTFTSDDVNSAAAGSHITVFVNDKATVYDSVASVNVSSFGGDGVYDVRAVAADAAGNESAPVSLSFTTDNTAPVISLAGATPGSYNNKNVPFTATVNETYFEGVTLTGVITYTDAVGKVLSTENINSPLSGTSHVFAKSFEGPYTVTVVATATDKAGNVSESKTLSFTVDTVAPVLTWDGVFEGIKGYDDTLFGSVSVSDDFADTKTFTLSDIAPVKNLITETENGFTMSQPTKVKANDGVYKATLTATDKAGNISTETKTLYLCRFGSILYWSDGTSEYADKYFKESPGSVTLMETSILPDINSISPLVSVDGSNLPGVSITSTRMDENNIAHVFSSSSFKQEGTYIVDAITKDSAGNTNIVSEKANTIGFTVDLTAPTIIVKGITQGDNIKGKSQSFTVSLTDNTVADMDTINASVDGKKLTGVPTTEVNGTETRTYTLNEGSNMNVTISGKDKAGNEKELTIRNVTVAKNAGNTTLIGDGDRPGSMFVRVGIPLLLGLLVLGFLLWLFFWKRRKEEEEDEDEGPEDEETDVFRPDMSSTGEILEAAAVSTGAVGAASLDPDFEDDAEVENPAEMDEKGHTGILGGTSTEILSSNSTEVMGSNSTEVMSGNSTEVMSSNSTEVMSSSDTDFIADEEL